MADIHEGGPASESAPEFYGPCAVHAPQTAYLVARTEGDPPRLANAMRGSVRAVDHDQPVSDVKTMDAVLDGTLG